MNNSLSHFTDPFSFVVSIVIWCSDTGPLSIVFWYVLLLAVAIDQDFFSGD
jgi:hypothetical protein